MKNLQTAILGAAVVTLLSGCGSFRTPEARSTIYDRDGTDLVIDHQSGISHTFKAANDIERDCRSPSPDVVVGSSKSFNESVPLRIMGNEQASGSSQFDTATLGGRSPAVLIAREILYRGCELASNYQLSVDQVLLLFKDSLEKIVLITQVPAQSAGTLPGASGSAAASTVPPETVGASAAGQ